MNHNRIGSCSKSFNTRASFWAHLDTPTKVRPKRAPFAELESSANPQPGRAALRSARFPACGFWRLSSRQKVVLSRCARHRTSAQKRVLKRNERHENLGPMKAAASFHEPLHVCRLKPALSGFCALIL